MVTPLLTRWTYRSLSLNHRYHVIPTWLNGHWINCVGCHRADSFVNGGFISAWKLCCICEDKTSVIENKSKFYIVTAQCKTIDSSNCINVTWQSLHLKLCWHRCTQSYVIRCVTNVPVMTKTYPSMTNQLNVKQHKFNTLISCSEFSNVCKIHWITKTKGYQMLDTKLQPCELTRLDRVTQLYVGTLNQHLFR